MDDLFKDFQSIQTAEAVPYIAHEGELARMERINKRQWILCIILFLGLILSNAGWIYYNSQFEEVVTTETYESGAEDGGVAISNGTGAVNYYGMGEIHKNNQNP